MKRAMRQLKSLNNEAMSLQTRGDYDHATVVAKEALQLAEKTLGPDHPDVATCLNNLATLLLSRSLRGGPGSLSSVRWRDGKALGPDHPDVAAALNILTALYVNPSPILGGRTALQACGPTITEKALGPGSSLCGDKPEQPCGGVLRQGRYTHAEPLVKRALASRRRPSARIIPRSPRPEQALLSCTTPRVTTRRPNRGASNARWRSWRRPSARMIQTWRLT